MWEADSKVANFSKSWISLTQKDILCLLFSKSNHMRFTVRMSNFIFKSTDFKRFGIRQFPIKEGDVSFQNQVEFERNFPECILDSFSIL